MSAACLLERYIEDAGLGSIEAPTCSYPPAADLAHFDYNLVRQHIKILHHTAPSEIYRSILNLVSDMDYIAVVLKSIVLKFCFIHHHCFA